jgi:hypothetical protein
MKRYKAQKLPWKFIVTQKCNTSLTADLDLEIEQNKNNLVHVTGFITVVSNQLIQRYLTDKKVYR